MTDGEEEEYIKAIEKTGFILVQKNLEKSAELKQLVRKTDCEVYVIDTLTTGEIEGNSKDAYINAFRKNCDLLKEILG